MIEKKKEEEEQIPEKEKPRNDIKFPNSLPTSLGGVENIDKNNEDRTKTSNLYFFG